MHDQRQGQKMAPIRVANVFPALHLRFTRLHSGLCLLGLSAGRLTLCERLLSVAQGLPRVSQTTKNGQGLAFDQLIDEVKQIWDTQAFQARFGKLDQRLCPVTHQVQHPDS